MVRKVSRPVKDINAALEAYYCSNGYINNTQIKRIFGLKSDSAIAKIKHMVQDEEVKRGVPIVIPKHVNVKIAYEMWGIDINELERNRKKLTELNLAQKKE